MPKQKYPSIEKWKMNCHNTWNNWDFNKSLPVVLLGPIKKNFALGWGLVLNLIPQKKKKKKKGRRVDCNHNNLLLILSRIRN